MNGIKWFYCFNADSGDCFEEIERDIPESPRRDELDAIAQELLIKYGYTDGGDYVCIGKGKRVTIEDLGGCLGDEIIDILEDKACDIFSAEDGLFPASKEDIKNLDSRIAQVLKEWQEERNVMSRFYTIPEPDRYYYHGDKNKEEQE